MFACPGEITSQLSAGSNALLKLGAAPLTEPGDVLDLFGLASAEGAEVELTPAARALLDELDAPMTADELVRAAGLDAAESAAGLSELELAALIACADGVYRRTQR